MCPPHAQADLDYGTPQHTRESYMMSGRLESTVFSSVVCGMGTSMPCVAHTYLRHLSPAALLESRVFVWEAGGGKDTGGCVAVVHHGLFSEET